ncbi:hypothetical protein [Kitasatospora cinereorecta]
MPGRAGGAVGGVLHQLLALRPALGAEHHVRGAQQPPDELLVVRDRRGQRAGAVEELVRLEGGEALRRGRGSGRGCRAVGGGVAVGAVRGRHGQLHPPHGLAAPAEQRTLVDLADEEARAQHAHREEPGPATRAVVTLEGSAQLHLVAVEVCAVLERQLVVGDSDRAPGGLLRRPRIAGAESHVAGPARQLGLGHLLGVTR